jgi:hypothetical protein
MDNFLRYSPLILLVSISLLAVGLSVNHSKVNITKAEESYLESLQKRDSLQNVIDSLQTEIFVLEDGCDYKEHRYEDVIFRYEMSLDYLKHNHYDAYRDFIRISQMKERYDRKTESEFKKEMQLNNL